MADITGRIIRAMKLDPSLYEEVEHDPSTFGQAMTVVVLANVAAGIGAVTRGGINGLVTGVIAALAGWFLWSYLTYIIGTRLLPEPQTRADYGELLRTIGFSSAPGLLRVAGVIPMLGDLVVLVSSVWMLAAMITAVRQALDYRATWRAGAVCAVGWIVQMVLLAIVFAMVHPS